MKANDMNTETAANDLTQLSSREQLSALMDSALPPDQTRFLLRRLRHDASLAECWERWRTAGEVMRGLAPAQRMPVDFASKVSAALHGGATSVPVAHRAGAPAWLRWGGGAAMAASLAVVALMARQGTTPAAAPPPQQVAAAAQPQAPAPKPAEQISMIDAGSQLASAATAVAALARPQRDAQRRATRPATTVQQAANREADATSQVAVLAPIVQAPQPDIVTRPWPRAVLPQYANGGLTVGFGEHARASLPHNPFQTQAGIDSVPPMADANGDPAREPQPAADTAEPKREPQARP